MIATRMVAHKTLSFRPQSGAAATASGGTCFALATRGWNFDSRPSFSIDAPSPKCETSLPSIFLPPTGEPMQLSSSRIKARSQAAVNSKLERKLWTYAAAATAAGVGMFAGTPADAEIVVTHVNTAISPSVALDLNHDGIVDFNLTKWLANASIQAFSYLLVCHEGYQAASHQCLSSSSQPNAANGV